MAGWVMGRGGGTQALTAPYPGGPPANTSVPEPPAAPEPAPGAPPAALWRYDSTLESAAAPVVWDQRLVLLADRRQVVCIDMSSGEEVWQRHDIGSSAGLDGNGRMVRHGDTVVLIDSVPLVAIDPETGAERWSEERYGYDLNEDFGPRLQTVETSVEDGQALVLRVTTHMDREEAAELAERESDLGDRDLISVPGLVLYDSQAREQRWHRPLVGAVDVIAYTHGEEEQAIAMVDYGDRREVIALRLSDGEIAWRDPLEDYQEHRLFDLGQQRMGAVSGNTASVYDPSGGVELWSEAVGPEDLMLSQVLGVESGEGQGDEEAPEMLFVAQGDSIVHAYDLRSADQVWSGRVREETGKDDVWLHLRSTPSGELLAAGTTADITMLDGATGEPLWRFQPADHQDRVSTEPYLGFFGKDDVVMVWDGATGYGFPLG